MLQYAASHGSSVGRKAVIAMLSRLDVIDNLTEFFSVYWNRSPMATDVVIVLVGVAVIRFSIP